MELGKELDIEHASLDITPTPHILQLLENLSVEPWRCVAELIDNSLDDFRRSSKEGGLVNIYYKNNCLIIEDNGSGMSHEELEKALRAGYSSKSKAGNLGLFGVGFNVASARLGRKATVFTKREQDAYWSRIIVDINQLVKNNSFSIKPMSVEIERPFDSGTMIIIELSKEHDANFSRPKYLKSIAEDLGRAYSFMLRHSVPGLTGDISGAPRSVVISVGDETVKPWVPCIWSEQRSVLYKGHEVFAVQKFDRELSEASVCEECGHWQNRKLAELCQACGSGKLTITQRRVWGWVGVQRYMDRLDFGLNFIRNGRTILFRDQDIFTYDDDATGESYKDYPVEWPADMGRIVGEVHCDHVRVDFIKREFDKDDNSWLGVVEIVRGSTSLQPKRAKGGPTNGSPLATIFNAYRINEPGTRYLIPGNGSRAIHEATKNWATKFYQNEVEYLTDDKWFKAAENHEKGGVAGDPAPGLPTPVLPDDEGTPPGDNSAPSKPISISPIAGNTGSAALPPAKPTGAPAETIKDKIVRWENGGLERLELSKPVTPASVGKTYNLTVWETDSEILSEDRKPIPVYAVPSSGSNIRLYAYRRAPAFTKFGRDITDVILMEAAQQIKTLSNCVAPLSQIFSELLGHFPDEERSEAVIRGRIIEMETRLQRRISPLISDGPSSFWNVLSTSIREEAEENAVSSGQSIVWHEAIQNGKFANFLPLSGVREIVSALPEKLFDGVIFKQHYATAHAQVARERASGYIIRALDDLCRLKSLNGKLNQYELETSNSALDFINDSLLSE
jgi:hypothetical protein